MSKKLSDFTVTVNLDGWHSRENGKPRVFRAGYKAKGLAITKGMVEALVRGDVIRDALGNESEILTLDGGKVEELVEAFGDMSDDHRLRRLFSESQKALDKKVEAEAKAKLQAQKQIVQAAKKIETMKAEEPKKPVESKKPEETEVPKVQESKKAKKVKKASK